MKAKKYIVAVLCILSLVLIIAKSVSGNLPDTDNIEQLGSALGALSLIPTVLAVALAFLSGDVVFSLIVALVIGQVILSIVSGKGVIMSFITSVPNTISEITNVFADIDNCRVLILCAIVGGLVGVLNMTKGFTAIARKLSKNPMKPRKANIIGQVFCFLFFFDDYANAMISGTVLYPITDRAKISREKLAYIVDSTAAPVAGIAIVSSWVAVELSVIAEGIANTGMHISEFELFLSSIPYCFYCIFAIVFMFLLSILGKEFGPMLAAERRARKGEVIKGEGNSAIKDSDSCSETLFDKKCIIVAAGGLLVLVAYVAVCFLLGNRDTISVITQGAFFSAAVVLIASAISNLFNISDGIKEWLNGASKMMPTIVILVLAWALAEVVAKMGTVYYLVEIISKGNMWQLVPAILFVCCCMVSFATGSYGCMFMVMPMAIPIAYAVMNNSIGWQYNFLPLCIAAVLTGSIFGDHCSPMTDCTILAALGSGCTVMDHTITQMPYALSVAITSVLCIVLSTIGLPVYLSLIIGIAVMTAIILCFGKKP